MVAGGRVADNGLAEGLHRSGLRADVYVIGDAVRARDLYTVGQEAAEVAETIGAAAGVGALSPARGRQAASG